MLRSFLSLGHYSALAASVALHAAAIAAGGHSASEARDAIARRAEVQPIAFDIEAEPAPVFPSAEERTPSSVEAQPVRSSHHHPYPVAPSHDAHPHDPSIVHAPLGFAPEPEAALLAAEPAETPLHFVLPAGNVNVGARAGTSGGEGTALAVEPAVTYDESQVSLPARLLASTPVAYPVEARAAGVEMDMTLDIVVDANGRVAHAESTSNAGYGLDRAAVAAVRTFRFSPAIRRGRPVGVRMKWTVLFRLR